MYYYFQVLNDRKTSWQQVFTSLSVIIIRQESMAHTHLEHVDNCQERRSLTVDDQNEVASLVHAYTATLTTS